jgi:hypothetical protein
MEALGIKKESSSPLLIVNPDPSSKDPIKACIVLADSEERSEKVVLENGKPTKAPIYTLEDLEIKGDVQVNFQKSEPYQHKGIQIEFKGVLQELRSGMSYCFARSIIELEGEGTLTENKSYAFTFNNLIRPVETHRAQQARTRYYLKVTVKGKKSSDLIVEKDIIMHLNADKVQLRDFRLPINFETKPVLVLELNKRSYYMDECIIGRLQLIAGKPRHKEISITLVQQELYNLNPESDNGLRLYHEITFVNLKDSIPRESQETNWIPFKMPLANLNLPPTFSFHPVKDTKVMFVTAYTLKIECTMADDKKWSLSVALPLWREKSV